MSALVLVLTCWSAWPDDVSRLEQASAILRASKARDNERDGKTVIHILTADRRLEDLSRDELIALATACNWAGRKAQQLEAADLILKKNPGDEEAWQWKANALYNLAFGKPISDPMRKQEIAFYEGCAATARGKDYWLLRKAVALCQGSVETRVGPRGDVDPDAVTHKDAYEAAFVTLHEAFSVNPKLQEGRGAEYFVDFMLGNHFPRLHRETRFKELLAGRYKGS